MTLVLVLFLLAILILSMVGYASYISGAQASNRWRRIFVILTFAMMGTCCLVFSLAVASGIREHSSFQAHCA